MMKSRRISKTTEKVAEARDMTVTFDEGKKADYVTLFDDCLEVIASFRIADGTLVNQNTGEVLLSEKALRDFIKAQ